MTQNPAWLLILAGLLIMGAGVAWLLAPSIPWLGRLPGDIRIEGTNFRFYFPVVTCLLVSLVATGILGLIRYISR